MQTQTQTTAFKQWFYDHEDALLATARDIFAHPELSGEETYSSHRLAQLLEEAGFRITWGIGGFDTAFLAEWGQGKPILGFLAEYDALPGLGQAPVCHVEPLSSPGHGCGHNLLGTACAGAAMALKSFLETSVSKPSENCNTFKKCTIRVYGCPAEEIMSGKIIMDEQNVFDDLSIAVTWHPFDRNRVSNDIWQAQDIKNYTFHGVSAHASRSPESGRSALDAAELMNIGVNYLREHVTDDVRMHYAYMDNGIPANVVPNFAKTNYFIRSTKRSRTEDASKRVDACAKGAAMMTGTTVDIELVGSCMEMKVNRPLVEVYYEAMTHIPTPEYTDAELDFAKDISEKAGLMNNGKYFAGLYPLENTPVPLSIGTDASQVSHTVPLITISAATMCHGTALHHWAAREQAVMSIGHKGMLYAARCMAEGTKLLLSKPEYLQAVWDYHNVPQD